MMDLVPAPSRGFGLARRTRQDLARLDADVDIEIARARGIEEIETAKMAALGRVAEDGVAGCVRLGMVAQAGVQQAPHMAGCIEGIVVTTVGAMQERLATLNRRLG